MYAKFTLPILLMGALLSSCGIRSASSDPDSGGAPLCTGSAIEPERLFLQQVGHDRAIIKWRGNRDGGAEARVACFGTRASALPKSSETTAVVTATVHNEALLTNLAPDTTYYYSVGGAGSSDALHSFRTAPSPGQSPADGNVRIWILGDPGTASAEAVAVRDSYVEWVAANGGEPTDVLLMLGDNAYTDGTDSQFRSRGEVHETTAGGMAVRYAGFRRPGRPHCRSPNGDAVAAD